MSSIRTLLSAFPRLRVTSLRSSQVKAPRRHASFAPPAASNWPWRIVSQDAATGAQVLERTIYARPPSFSPRMLWLVIIAWTPMCLMIFENVRYAYTHPRKTIEQPYKPPTAETTDGTASQAAQAGVEQVQALDAEAAKGSSSQSEGATTSSGAVADDDQMSLLDFVSYTAGIGFVGLGITAFALYYPTRVITRLTQVQRRPAAGKAVETLVKVENAAMAMWRWPRRFAEPRLLRPDELKVEMIRQGKVDSPYLKLHIKPKRESRRRLLPSLDDQSYRLAFHKIQPGDYGIGGSKAKKKREEDQLPVEVVVSLNRLQEALGSVRQAERNLK